MLTNSLNLFLQSNIKSLKHCLYSAARFAGDLFNCCPDATQLQTDLLWVLFPLILDGCTENLSDLISLTVERAVGRAESDEFLAKVYRHVLANTFGILLPNKQVQKLFWGAPRQFNDRLFISGHFTYSKAQNTELPWYSDS